MIKEIVLVKEDVRFIRHLDGNKKRKRMDFINEYKGLWMEREFSTGI